MGKVQRRERWNQDAYNARFAWLYPYFYLAPEAAINDVNAVDLIPIEAGTIYLMNKGYVDYWRLYNRIDRQGAFFIKRAKDNMKYRVEASYNVDNNTGVISDEYIWLTAVIVAKDYPDIMRLVIHEDFSTENVYRFLTNGFDHEAIIIAELYREYWQVNFSSNG